MSKTTETELNPRIMEQWERLKVIFASAEDDVLKTAHGNTAASIRARKALRQFRTEATDLVKLTLSEAKSRKKQND